MTWAAVLYQSLGNTMFGYASWGWLLARHPAATVSPFALLVPVFGMSTSALLMNEPLQSWKLLAAALVMSGLALNLAWPRLRKTVGPLMLAGYSKLLSCWAPGALSASSAARGTRNARPSCRPGRRTVCCCLQRRPWPGTSSPGQWHITTTPRYVGVDKFPPIVTGRLAAQGIVFPTRPQTSSKMVCISPDDAAIDRCRGRNERQWRLRCDDHRADLGWLRRQGRLPKLPGRPYLVRRRLPPATRVSEGKTVFKGANPTAWRSRPGTILLASGRAPIAAAPVTL